VTGRVGGFETGDVGGQAKIRTAASGSEETGVCTEYRGTRIPTNVVSVPRPKLVF